MADNDKKVDLGDYVEVSQRIADVREKLYPNGSFQPASVERPYSVEVIDGQAYVIYVAAFYRSPDDKLPGIGMAWEQVPGRTPYTRGSELQNAETSAWGRALVAALAADTRKGIASADEVRMRTAMAAAILPPADFARAELMRLLNRRGIDSKVVAAKFAEANPGDNLRTSTNEKAIQALLDSYRETGA
ncbi:hypothetical protein [Nocardia otitidiscaviarum]|uniref:hypothetical protein n=1 Tax=Nocardia otitidiscaviarum TaxID=1823 RepID=UPI0011DCB61C|nr:hypothetical protein [Nocardia otitidiscaviarum]